MDDTESVGFFINRFIILSLLTAASEFSLFFKFCLLFSFYFPIFAF